MTDASTQTVDDGFLDGVYYDAGVGEFYTIDRNDETGEAILNDMDGDEVERIGPDEWLDIKADMFPVEKSVAEDPVEYYKAVVNQLRRKDPEFDQDFLFADRMTEVVER